MENKKNTVWCCYIGCLLGVLVLVGIDQITKQMAIVSLKGQEPLVLIPGVFELTYLENTGAAFGIFQNKQWLFVGVSILIIAALLIFFMKLPKNRQNLPVLITMSVVLAGAIGNMIDRLWLGYVVDFLYFSLIDFPVFNVADIYVTVGAALFTVFYMISPEGEKDK